MILKKHQQYRFKSHFGSYPLMFFLKSFGKILQKYSNNGFDKIEQKSGEMHL